MVEEKEYFLGIFPEFFSRYNIYYVFEDQWTLSEHGPDSNYVSAVSTFQVAQQKIGKNHCWDKLVDLSKERKPGRGGTPG